MITALFLIHITIWNYDTGDKLWEMEKVEEYHSLKECYLKTKDFILPIIEGIRTYIPNASANFNCRPSR